MSTERGNPLKDDEVLIQLLKDLDSVQTLRQFTRWKASFLARFETFLAQSGIHAAEEAYRALGLQSRRLVKLLRQLKQHVIEENLRVNHATVKARLCLSNLQSQLADVDLSFATHRHTEYTSFHMGAVLVRDGFQCYDALSRCNDIFDLLRESLADVADRQVLEEMKRFSGQLKSFCDVMADLGLYNAMLKVRQLVDGELDDDDEETPANEAEPGEEGTSREEEEDNLIPDGELEPELTETEEESKTSSLESVEAPSELESSTESPPAAKQEILALEDGAATVEEKDPLLLLPAPPVEEPTELALVPVESEKKESHPKYYYRDVEGYEKKTKDAPKSRTKPWSPKDFYHGFANKTDWALIFKKPKKAVDADDQKGEAMKPEKSQSSPRHKRATLRKEARKTGQQQQPEEPSKDVLPRAEDEKHPDDAVVPVTATVVSGQPVPRPTETAPRPRKTELAPPSLHQRDDTKAISQTAKNRVVPSSPRRKKGRRHSIQTATDPADQVYNHDRERAEYSLTNSKPAKECLEQPKRSPRSSTRRHSIQNGTATSTKPLAVAPETAVAQISDGPIEPRVERTAEREPISSTESQRSEKGRDATNGEDFVTKDVPPKPRAQRRLSIQNVFKPRRRDDDKQTADDLPDAANKDDNTIAQNDGAKDASVDDPVNDVVDGTQEKAIESPRRVSRRHSIQNVLSNLVRPRKAPEKDHGTDTGDSPADEQNIRLEDREPAQYSIVNATVPVRDQNSVHACPPSSDQGSPRGSADDEKASESAPVQSDSRRHEEPQSDDHRQEESPRRTSRLKSIKHAISNLVKTKKNKESDGGGGSAHLNDEASISQTDPEPGDDEENTEHREDRKPQTSTMCNHTSPSTSAPTKSQVMSKARAVKDDDESTRLPDRTPSKHALSNTKQTSTRSPVSPQKTKKAATSATQESVDDDSVHRPDRESTEYRLRNSKELSANNHASPRRAKHVNCPKETTRADRPSEGQKNDVDDHSVPRHSREPAEYRLKNNMSSPTKSKAAPKTEPHHDRASVESRRKNSKQSPKMSKASPTPDTKLKAQATREHVDDSSVHHADRESAEYRIKNRTSPRQVNRQMTKETSSKNPPVATIGESRINHSPTVTSPESPQRAVAKVKRSKELQSSQPTDPQEDYDDSSIHRHDRQPAKYSINNSKPACGECVSPQRVKKPMSRSEKSMEAQDAIDDSSVHRPDREPAEYRISSKGTAVQDRNRPTKSDITASHKRGETPDAKVASSRKPSKCSPRKQEPRPSGERSALATAPRQLPTASSLEDDSHLADREPAEYFISNRAESGSENGSSSDGETNSRHLADREPAKYAFKNVSKEVISEASDPVDQLTVYKGKAESSANPTEDRGVALVGPAVYTKPYEDRSGDRSRMALLTDAGHTDMECQDAKSVRLEPTVLALPAPDEKTVRPESTVLALPAPLSEPASPTKSMRAKRSPLTSNSPKSVVDHMYTADDKSSAKSVVTQNTTLSQRVPRRNSVSTLRPTTMRGHSFDDDTPTIQDETTKKERPRRRRRNSIATPQDATTEVSKEEAKPAEEPEPPAEEPIELSPHQAAVKRKKCYMWYARLGQPNRETMRRRVAALPDTCSDKITLEDVDLLPWILKGTMLNVKVMNRLIVEDDEVIEAERLRERETRAEYVEIQQQ